MLEIKNLYKKIGPRAIIDRVSFSIETGEITALIGENGSGKTMIMNSIMGLTRYQSGQVLLDGRKLRNDDYNLISFVPDQIIILDQWRIGHALAYMESYYRTFDGAKAREVMDFFQLDEKMQIRKLSKGNIAKVNILLGLCLDCDYLIMDEPFSGIDKFTREDIAQVFNTNLIENRGVLISTHEIDDIEQIIDKAILLKEGRIVKEFYPEEVREEEGRSILDVMREVYRG